MKALNFVALILVVVGAINWGFWGFFQFDLVAWLCGGNTSGMSRFVYGVVGIAGVWSLSFLFKCCKHCCDSKKGCDTKKGCK